MERGILEFRKDISESEDLKGILINAPQYDIIYVDWGNGTDNLKANALLLKTVIRHINEIKVANGANGIEKNVVIGQSMGGVIARYALKKMEDAGENHDTRLYISHDAPHQGANIPLAFQALNLHAQNIRARAFIGTAIYHLFGGNKDNILDMVNSGAAKQMLSNRIGYINLQNQFVLYQGYYNDWQNELKNLGYPQQCRNIAISNGSECGSPYPITPGSNLYLYDGYLKTKFLFELFVSYYSPLVMLGGALTGQVGSAVLASIPGSNKFQFHFEMNSMANGGGNLLYKGKVVYKKKILWFIPVNYTITNMSYTAPQGFNTIDQYPGGVHSLDPQNETVNDNNDTYSSSYHIFVNTGFSFIPTTSALDIGKGQVALNQADYYQSYIGANPPPEPKNTPFDNFITAFAYGTGLNEEHISFTPRNGKWLAAELKQLDPAPSADCNFYCSLSSNSIQGPNTVCGNSTYTIGNLPPSVTILWTVNGAALISGSNNTNSVNLMPNGSGNVFLKASINSECGYREIIKNLYSELPLAHITAVQNSAICQKTDYVFYATPQIPGYIYNWYVNGVLQQSGTDHVFSWYTPCNISKAVYCTITNECGTSEKSNFFHMTGECTWDCSLIVYPNPAGNQLNISYQNMQSDDVVWQPVNYSVDLYNSNGILQPVIQSENADGEVVINTSNLPNGIYYLHIQQGNQVIKKQVIIQH